jgi:hypothetical protein
MGLDGYGLCNYKISYFTHNLLNWDYMWVNTFGYVLNGDP